MANLSQSQRDLFGFSGDSTLWQGFINFWASVILLQNIIPISLYVSIEVVKSFQALFIYSDLNMYYEPTDSPCIPKSVSIYKP
jgi:phospholipid-translocating ATPase